MYAVLLISWIHGCIGIYFWMRTKPYFGAVASWLLALAVILPTISMLGLYQGGRAVQRASGSPEWRADNLSRDKVGTATEQASLELISSAVLYGYFGLIGFALVARGLRAMVERRRGLVRLSYGNGKTVRVPIGLSVLEASTRFNIPHSSVCGGRARCSTCRIRIIGDCSQLPTPSNREAFVLERASVRATTPRSASPASCGPEPMSPSSRYSPPTQPRRRPRRSSQPMLDASATLSTCSWICADRQNWPNSFCRSIPFSSSTAS
jgi:ferredoxin